MMEVSVVESATRVEDARQQREELEVMRREQAETQRELVQHVEAVTRRHAELRATVDSTGETVVDKAAFTVWAQEQAAYVTGLEQRMQGELLSKMEAVGLALQQVEEASAAIQAEHAE